MRVLINSTKAKMAVNRFAPNLTDIPEEMGGGGNTLGREMKTSAFDNPNFTNGDPDRETTEETGDEEEEVDEEISELSSDLSSDKLNTETGRENFVLKNKGEETQLMPKFNEVNAKIYESFRHELPSKQKDKGNEK